MGRKAILMTGIVFLLWAGSVCAEPITRQIYYTKKCSNGALILRFSLWDAAVDGTEVWSEEKTLRVTGGMLKTYLGDTNPLDSVDFSQQYWIDVEKTKDGVVYTAVGVREAFSVVPYALYSQSQADSIASTMIQSNAVTEVKISDGAVTNAKIGTGAVTDAKITGPISASKISSISLDTDTVDGSHAAAFAASSHSHAATEITSGTLDNARFSAYSDLSAEGYLDNSADTDILIRSQSDARYATLSTPQTISGAKTFSNQITSSVATGTAPFSVSSTTLVPNLNAEKLGGYSVNDFDSRYGQAAPYQTPRANTITTVASTGICGWEPSITIGTDGLPVISFYRSSYLGVIKCGNASCSSGNTNTQVDSELSTGEYTSIAIGTDGFPIISYYNYGDYDLKIVKCGDASCTSGNTITTLDSAGDVGKYSSIAMGTDGLAVISYYDDTNDDLKVVKCGNASCSSGNTITILDSSGVVGKYTSIAIGTDGLPIISYYDDTNSALKAAKCTDTSCSGATFTTIEETGFTGFDTSVAIGADGLPIIAYNDFSNRDLKVAKCGDAACSAGNTITTLDSTGDVGWRPSITIGPDGLPLMSYHDNSNENLKFIKCGNSACSANNTAVTLDSTGDLGAYSSLTIGTDGLPIIAYFDETNYDLKVIKCANPFCINFWSRR